MTKQIWNELSKINANEYKEKKGKFDYLSWAHAVREMLKVFPEATWEVHEYDGMPYMQTTTGYYVKVSVTIDGISRTQIHPVLDNKNQTIELKKTEDSFASAANYLKKIGWKKGQPCFYKINLNKDIPKKYLNSSARDIKNKKKISFFKKYISNFKDLNIQTDGLKAAIIIPDKDIIPGAETLSPAFIVFENYEKILNWNRSLRFALAVCTLKDNFRNEI